MAKAVAALLALLASAACSSGTAPPVPTPTRSTCSLPVVISQFNAATGTWSADTTGFLAYPGGEFTAANGHGVRYDASRKRWLPSGVPTPDGAAYVYADSGGAIHETSVDSGLDRILIPGSWVPLGFVGSSLYLAELRPVSVGAFAGGGYTEGGVARTDLSGTKPVFVAQHGGPWWVSSLGAWTLDRADGLEQAPDRVLHLDLGTGAVQPWLSDVGDVTVVGFDTVGHPFVVSEAGVRILLITGPHAARQVYSGTREAGWPQLPAYAHGDDVWFSGFSIKDPTFEAPVWLYRPGSGLQKSVGPPGFQVNVAGPCL